MLTIVFTNKNDQLKRVEFKGQPTDKYMTKGNMIQWYEVDGVRVSFDVAFKIINEVV